MLTGSSVERKTIMFASLGAHLGGAIKEGELALEGDGMHVGTAGEKSGCGDGFYSIR